MDLQGVRRVGLGGPKDKKIRYCIHINLFYSDSDTALKDKNVIFLNNNYLKKVKWLLLIFLLLLLRVCLNLWYNN